MSKIEKSSIYGRIPARWDIVKLNAVCVQPGGIQTGPFGSQLHQEDYQPVGTPIITVEHLGENRILNQDLPRISEEDRIRLSKYIMQEGDIIFSRVGSVDRRAIARQAENGWLFSGRCLRVRPDTNRIDPNYLSWFFGLSAFKEHIRQIAVGATMPSLNTELLSNIDVILPSLPEQRSITHILDTLDDKIELNRRMNETLEAIARSIFQSWFVDFDPVRAKMEGQQPVGMDAETAALFPDSFEDSALGKIPKGWKVKTVEEISERVGMGPFGSSIKVETFVPEGVPIISGQHLRGFMLEDNSFNFITHEHANKLKNAMVRRGDVIFTHAGNIGQVAYIPEDSRYDSYVMSQRQFFMRCNLAYVSPCFMALYFSSPEGQHQLLANTSSTGVPSISRPVTNLRSMKLSIPPNPIMEMFDKTIRPLLIKYRNNLNEINTLVAMRDALLPKLLSGEIRVKDAERTVEDKL